LSTVSTTRARDEAGQVWGTLLPTLTANGGWTRNQYPATIELPTGATTTQRIVIIPLNQFEASFKAEVPVVDVAKWLRTASALSTASAAEARQQLSAEQVRRQVVTGFYLFAGTRSLVASTQKSLAVAGAQLEQQTARRSAGAATDLEVLRAQAEVERNKQLLADAEAQLANAQQALSTLTGLEPTDVPPIPPDDLHGEPSVAELDGQLGELPAVRSAELEVDAASQARSAAAFALLPTVNAQFTQRLTNATGFQNQYALWNAGLTFNWRVDALGVEGIRLADAATQTAALMVEKSRTQARDQLRSDGHRVKAAITKVAAARAQVDAAQRAAALASERNGAGVATQLDVIQSDRDVFAAEVSDIQARLDLASARASLRLSSGLSLEAQP